MKSIWEIQGSRHKVSRDPAEYNGDHFNVSVERLALMCFMEWKLNENCLKWNTEFPGNKGQITVGIHERFS